MILDFKVIMAKTKDNPTLIQFFASYKTSNFATVVFSLVLYFWLKRGRRLKSHEPSWCFSSS